MNPWTSATHFSVSRHLPRKVPLRLPTPLPSLSHSPTQNSQPLLIISKELLWRRLCQGYSMLTFNLRWFMNPVCLFVFPIEVLFFFWFFFYFFLYLITLVLEKEKLAVCFMISFFPIFCLFRFPLSIFIQRYCTCVLPRVCLPPSAKPPPHQL